MRQPDCDEEGYGECIQQPAQTPEQPTFSWHDAMPALMMLTALLVSYGLFYWWARRHHKYRISDLSQKGVKALHWLAFAIIGGMVVFVWHIVYGGPL